MTTQVRVLGCLVLVLGVACGREQPALSGAISAGGSSTVYPLTTAVVESFVRTNPAVRIAVTVSGTSAGFQEFCQGDLDIQNASRPITEGEHAACAQRGIDYLEVPVAYDALTIVVHPANDWAADITTAELKTLWEPSAEKRVMRWSDVRSTWPSEPIRLHGPGPNSGTFDYFTEAITGGVGQLRTDYVASEDDTVIVRGIESDRLALGYLGYSYYKQHEMTLKALAVAGVNADRVGPVVPSPENVRRGAYLPLSRSLFIYVNAKAVARPDVSAFLDFCLAQDEALVEEVGGIAMSPRVYDLVRQRTAKRVTGSVFAPGGANDNLELLLARPD